MTRLEMRSVRTAAASGRLATLQRRAENVSPALAGVVRPALKELSDAIEELQVANDELELHAAELAKAAAQATAAQRRFDELLQVLPCACVWTSTTGEITEANPAAAALLNVSPQHLTGRSLVLFLTDRTPFQTALEALAAGAAWQLDLEGELRPRERRARPVQVLGRRLEHEQQVCWFFLEGRSKEGQ